MFLTLFIMLVWYLGPYIRQLEPKRFPIHCRIFKTIRLELKLNRANILFTCPFSWGTDFRHHNLASIDVRFWRSKSIPALKEIQMYNGRFRCRILVQFTIYRRLLIGQKPTIVTCTRIRALIHYNSRIATAIRGFWWMKIATVNSGLKGLK